MSAAHAAFNASSVPVGAPKRPSLATPPAPAAPATPDVAFAVPTLLQSLQPASSEPLPEYRVPQTPRGVVTPDSHIQMLEPEVSAASTIPYAALATSDGQAHLLACLDQLGFAVVSNVISPEETAHAERLFATDLASIIDTAASKPERVANLLEDPVHRWDLSALSLGGKFASDFGLPHGRMAWYLRAHPAVRDVFGKIFNTEELCVGTDNVFYNPKPLAEGANPGCVSNLWPHADQNVHVKPSGKYDCYQGVLYVWPAEPDTSATVVWPRSNQLVFPSLMNKTNAKGHFCMLDKSEHAAFVQHARRVPVPAGGLLLWNSKTIHQGWPHGARLAQPICYEPSKRRDHKALASKVGAVETGMPTSHWASIGKIHSVASGNEVGGDAKYGVVLRHQAHKHCIGANGRIRPDVEQLL